MSSDPTITILDGAVRLTYTDGHEGALLTVRGKDHDLGPRDLRRLAIAALQMAELTDDAIASRRETPGSLWSYGDDALALEWSRDNVSHRAIADRLGRTEQAVAARLSRLRRRTT